jgi:hypothetical protein
LERENKYLKFLNENYFREFDFEKKQSKIKDIYIKSNSKNINEKENRKAI